MKILVISDEESNYLWDNFQKDKLEGAELIISCGDLQSHYLSFLATFSNVPVLYVRGNHDNKYDLNPPDGCICIDDTIYVHNGIRIMGLGGSMRYKPGSDQFTEKEMQRRIRRLRRKIARHKGVDILVTHAPAYRLGDGDDLPHQGFQTFLDFMDQYSPRFLLHGHVHLNYGRGQKRYSKYKDTHVINGFQRCLIDYDATEPVIHP